MSEIQMYKIYEWIYAYLRTLLEIIGVTGTERKGMFPLNAFN